MKPKQHGFVQRVVSLARHTASVLLCVLCLAEVAFGQGNVHLTLGNPSKATKDETKKNNFLVAKDEYALSYNDERGTPNWVSYRLAKEDVGAAPRKSGFSPDTELPDGFKVVRHKDYTNGGFDRGHMCPHCDRSSTKEVSFGTFVMTNVIPQSADVNQHAWNQLEFYLRTLAVNDDKEIYIICGPSSGIGGVGGNGLTTDLADEKVTVPSHCWKIAVILDDMSGDDRKRLDDDDTRIIAVVMPNDDTVREEWGKYRTSVAKIEKLTQLQFFDAIQGDLAALKKAVDDDESPIFEMEHGKPCLEQARHPKRLHD